MTRSFVIPFLCLGAMTLYVTSLRGQDTAKPAAASSKKSTDLKAALIGTWKMTSMKVNGQDNPLPDTAVTYKHVTPDGFTWLSFEKDSGKMFRAAGGTYTLKGDAYTETIEYGMGDDFDAIKNASHPFTCRIEGDTWHHTGKLASGTTLDEKWTRVKPDEAPKAK